MFLKTMLFAAGLGTAALIGSAAPAQARTLAVSYNDGYYQPVNDYRERNWRDRGRYDRYDRRDDRRDRYSWNNDRRYRQHCWKEWRYDRWRHKRYRVKICR